MKAFIEKKLVAPLVVLIRQGITPTQLALAVSLGMVLATVPVFGAATLLCLLMVWLFRVNPGAILLVNQLAYPLQFLLYLPLIRGGEWLFHCPHLPFSVQSVFAMFKANLLQAIGLLWWSTLHALVVWVMVAVPLTWCLHTLLARIFLQLKNRLEEKA